MSCEAIIKSGDRKGQTCNAKTKNGSTRCGRHPLNVMNNVSKPNKGCITITFGGQVENHHGNQQCGSKRKPISASKLKSIWMAYHRAGYTTEYHDLTRLLPNVDLPEASILIVRSGLKSFTKETNCFEILKSLEWDKKAWMKGRVCNKKARWNCCFADWYQSPNYEQKKGTIHDFKKVPFLQQIRKGLENIVQEKDLYAEGNYYYDTNQCYIGYHGDTERNMVIAFRFGDTFKIKYRWYIRLKPISPEISIALNDGDFYIMSEKAVGTDWRKSSIYTLRHSAGI